MRFGIDASRELAEKYGPRPAIQMLDKTYEVLGMSPLPRKARKAKRKRRKRKAVQACVRCVKQETMNGHEAAEAPIVPPQQAPIEIAPEQPPAVEMILTQTIEFRPYRRDIRIEDRETELVETTTTIVEADGKSQKAARDRILVDRFKEGDESAFSELMALYRDQAYQWVYRSLGNHEDAEEVTQDAFIRVHRGLKDFRGESSFATWLYTIAINLARNRYWYWWRRKRDRSLSLEAEIGPDSNTTFAETFADDRATDPEDATVTQEFLERVTASMEQLSDKHREILILRNVQNLSYEEVADILKMSVGTVKSRINRARERLRNLLGGETL